MAITRVQSKTFNSGTTAATSHTITFDSGLTAGNYVILAAALGSIPRVLSATGITWTYCIHTNGSSTNSMIAIGRVFAGASASIIVTITGSVVCSIAAAEYSGLNGSFDQSATATGASTSPASGATGTTSSANQLWIGAICGRNAQTFSSPTNGFSIVGQDKTTLATASDRSVCLLEKIVSTTGTANAGATMLSDTWLAQVLTFDAAVSAGGLLRTPPMTGGTV